MAVIPNQRLWRTAALMNPALRRCGDALRVLPAAYWRRGAILLLMGYCCHVLAGLFWLFLPLPIATTPAQPLPEAPAAVPGQQQAAIDIEALKGLHLFGDPGDPASQLASLPVVAIEAEETRLDLRLLGLVVSDVETSARAVIAHRNQQELYAVGDGLPGGAQVSLHQVLPGRVIIDNAGRYESLWLYEEEGERQAGTERLARAPTRPAAGAVSPAAKIPPAPEIVAAAPESSAVPSRLITEKTISDPQTLADVIQFTPVHADGKVRGYRVAPGRAPAIFEAVGLKRNDVITSVNGITLDDPTRALQIYRGLQGADAASFELVRDGKPRVIEVQLDQVGGRG